MKQLFQSVADALAQGKSVVLCSVIAASGSTPRGIGAKMLVLADGSAIGTIGGGAVEHAAINLAMQLHDTRHSFVRGFDLSSSQKSDLGMICGGKATVHFQYLDCGNPAIQEMIAFALQRLEAEKDSWLITAVREDSLWQMGVWADGALHFAQGLEAEMVAPHILAKSTLVQGDPLLYIEPLVQKGRLYLFGGGHVAQALAPAASAVGFRVVIFEDRERFTDIDLFPGAESTILGNFSEIEQSVAIGPDDYIAILTRGHEADHAVLEQALRTPAAYIGLMGSRHKMHIMLQKLHSHGFGEADCARIHNPIGIAIHAETPAELAVSITAELISHRAILRRQLP